MTTPTSPTPPGPDRQAVTEHPIDERIETLGKLLGGVIRLGDRDLIEDGIKEMRARLDQVELNMLGVQPDPADLATAGILAPNDDDLDESERAWWNAPQGEKMRAALETFAVRLADRISFPGPAATCGHDDDTPAGDQ